MQWRTLIAVLVVVLCIVLAGTAAASHIHRSSSIEQHCGFCDLSADFLALVIFISFCAVPAASSRFHDHGSHDVYEHRILWTSSIRPPPVL